MIELYLDVEKRQKILDYDIENSEHDYDRDMYYIINTENQIICDIIYGMGVWELEEIGFKPIDICKIMEDDVMICFTNKSEYYIKEVEL